MNAKLPNKPWSNAPIHPFIIERIQLWSVINKFIENIPQIYVIIHLWQEFKEWDNYYPQQIFNQNLSIISICAIFACSIDILIAIYTLFVYKRDSIKRIPRHEIQGSNVQINDYMNIDQTPLAGDI